MIFMLAEIGLILGFTGSLIAVLKALSTQVSKETMGRKFVIGTFNATGIMYMLIAYVWGIVIEMPSDILDNIFLFMGVAVLSTGLARGLYMEKMLKTVDEHPKSFARMTILNMIVEYTQVLSLLVALLSIEAFQEAAGDAAIIEVIRSITQSTLYITLPLFAVGTLLEGWQIMKSLEDYDEADELKWFQKTIIRLAMYSTIIILGLAYYIYIAMPVLGTGS